MASVEQTGDDSKMEVLEDVSPGIAYSCCQLMRICRMEVGPRGVQLRIRCRRSGVQSRR